MQNIKDLLQDFQKAQVPASRIGASKLSIPGLAAKTPAPVASAKMTGLDVKKEPSFGLKKPSTALTSGLKAGLGAKVNNFMKK